MKLPPADPPSQGPTDSPASPEEVMRRLHVGDYTAALELSERLVQAQPESVEAHRLRAVGLLAMERPEEALDALDRTLELHAEHGSELDPENLANVYATRALVSLQQDDLGDAAEDAAAALALNPDDRDALLVAAITAADEGDHGQAHRHAARLAELDPESPHAHAWLARILSAQGRHAEAARAAARSRELGLTTSELEDIEREGK